MSGSFHDSQNLPTRGVAGKDLVSRVEGFRVLRLLWIEFSGFRGLSGCIYIHIQKYVDHLVKLPT